MPDWSEPIKGQGSAHDFTATDTLVANYERTEQVDVPDFDDKSKLVARTIHRFLDNGVAVDVWGSADLDGKLRAVKPGSLVRIVFLGREDLEGGKQIKRFSVQVDESAEAAGETLAETADDDDIPF